ncbi:NAD(P)/FAD-dependent oxidoreductase [Noviherbaspirillum soli]|uniref:NAD(P)/FAD-dependent oxidoreductase n=1 Tax=Noviherbaspirillum soli TaxID=1064518 RepID=UPI00188ABB50|nr:FAD-dependent oxidoreductase [Noviherbaspirillum soli]
MKHLIIGNGPAGVIAAETIVGHAPQDQVVLLGDEPEPSYSRMAIPYLLMGNITEQGTYLRKDPQHFSSRGIRLEHGRAKSIDTAANIVHLADGRGLGYDRLLLATGSSPVAPPIPGMDSPGVHTCWTMEDARRIMQLARPGARVVQMGAGFIGCIIMEALAARGVDLSVIEMGDRMVPRMMGAGAGNMIKAWCQHKGIKVYTSTRVNAIEPGTPLRLTLSSGEVVEADLIISATGVKPQIDIARDSGIHCKDGILVDATMQSSVPGIYAAGDCAEAFDQATGHTVVSAIQPNAAEQGRCAGMNMVGRALRMTDVPQINVLDTLGLISTSFGRWDGVPGGEHAELIDVPAFRFLRLEFEGDRLIGSNAVGHTQHAGVLRGLISQRVRLGAWKDRLKEDPTRLMEAYIACAQQQEVWRHAS